ncbi:MAG: ABC transporter ATP-binding protein [Chloroflexi bacterium]|nr:ABC transporter ATP-binding protein [Chloroflexota bacterium]
MATMNSQKTIIQIKNLSYKPMGADEDVLSDISLDFQKGDFALLLGPSGCGKSTLTRCLNGLIPHLDQGEMRGSVVVAGKSTADHEIHEFASTIGMIFQNPDDQIISLRVVDEVAWGVENLGLPHEEIVQRVDQFMELLGISHLKERLTFAISGGQKQKVSIASNLAMLQDVLSLDDPTTDLDPVCKAEVVQTLAYLHRELGKTLIVIEHDLNDLIELANRIIFMEGGRVIYDGPTDTVISDHYDKLLEQGMNMPQHIEIAHAVLQQESRPKAYPILKEDAFAILQELVESHPALPPESTPSAEPKGAPVLAVRDLEFSYAPGRPVLRGLSFDIRVGEFVAIIGANGSGKSTLINNFVGLLLPDQGQVVVNGHDTKNTNISDLVEDIGYVFQNPEQQLFAHTVYDEASFSLRIRGVADEEVERLVAEALDIVELGHLRDRHPFSLSRGQRQKLAVATALVHKPEIILLDEPTTGQDRRSLSGLLNMLSALDQQGNTTIMVTHDMDIAAAYATRVIVMSGGEIVMDGRPEDVFYDQFDNLSLLNLKPPTVVDFCRRLEAKGVPRCLTVEQLVDYLEEVRKM